MFLEKPRIVMKIESQFSYSPLIWMLNSRSLNNKINRLHERALKIVYSDYKSSFNTLLEMDGSYSVHHRNIQSLALEIYKFSEHKDCYSVLFPSTDVYGFLCSWDIYRNQSVYFVDRIEWLVSLWVAGLQGDIGLWCNVGSNWVNVFLRYFYLHTVTVKML